MLRSGGGWGFRGRQRQYPMVPGPGLERDVQPNGDTNLVVDEDEDEDADAEGAKTRSSELAGERSAYTPRAGTIMEP